MFGRVAAGGANILAKSGTRTSLTMVVLAQVTGLAQLGCSHGLPELFEGGQS